MNNIFQIALNTYRESIRSKVLYAVLIFCFVLVIISSLFGNVTIGDQIKVIKDFGLMSISFFTVCYAIIAGATLLFKELQRKTIYNILSKAVTRSEFILGKQLGLMLTSWMMISLMSLALFVYLFAISGNCDFSIFIASAYCMLELTVISAAVIFFSCITVTTALTGIFSFSIFIAGRSINYIQDFINSENLANSSKTMLELIYYSLPHLDQLNVANNLVYDIFLPWQHFCYSAIYCFAYASVLLVVSCVFFERRDFN